MRSKPPSRPGGTNPSGNPGRPRRAIGSDTRAADPRGQETRSPDPRGAAPSGNGAARPPPRDRSSGPRPSRPTEPGQAPRPAARLPAQQPHAEARPRSRPEQPRHEQPRHEQPRPEQPRHEQPLPEPAVPRRETLRAPAQPSKSTPDRVLAAPKGTAPRGSVWLHGIHPVAAALANPARRLKRLLLTEDAEAALASRIPQPWPLAVERVDRARLEHLLGRDTVHQGAGLLADLLTPPSLATVLAKPGPLLVLDQVTDPRNIGATLRSAAAFGAAAVILQERNAPEETGVMAKAASGALETVPLLRAVNLARTLVALKAAGLWVIGLDAAAPPLRGSDLADRRIVLVLGAEGDGMRRLTRETCDVLYGLAMPGVMESLNVSAAATLALYELGRPG